jgi:hypothetical protein
MNRLADNNRRMIQLIAEWEPKLLSLPQEVIAERRNSQNRTIKQILGHTIDSATNNIHRIIHLQHQPSPLIYPDYANLGNNDRWIALNNYQEADWNNLVGLWKHITLHVAHVIRNADESKFANEWITALGEKVSLYDMMSDYLRHFQLHLREIEALMKQE